MSQNHCILSIHVSLLIFAAMRSPIVSKAQAPAKEEQNSMAFLVRALPMKLL